MGPSTSLPRPLVKASDGAARPQIAADAVLFTVNGAALADVRFGSKADMTLSIHDVRFAPNSGHQSADDQCPLSANNDIASIITGRHKKGPLGVSTAAIPSAIRRKWGHPGWVFRRLIQIISVRWIDLAVRLITPRQAMRLFVTPSTPR